MNTSIRPGWFYHEEEDEKVRTLKELIHIYYNSVGGNATFLLNIPPTKEGLFHETDRLRLLEMGDYLRSAFEHNLVKKAKLSANFEIKGHEIEQIREDCYDTWFMTDEGVTTCDIEIQWEERQVISHIVLKENIRCSQRIEKFAVSIEKQGVYETVYEGKVVGHKRIIPFEPLETTKVKISILDARVAPTLSFIRIY